MLNHAICHHHCYNSCWWGLQPTWRPPPLDSLRGIVRSYMKLLLWSISSEVGTCYVLCKWERSSLGVGAVHTLAVFFSLFLSPSRGPWGQELAHSPPSPCTHDGTWPLGEGAEPAEELFSQVPYITGSESLGSPAVLIPNREMRPCGGMGGGYHHLQPGRQLISRQALREDLLGARSWEPLVPETVHPMCARVWGTGSNSLTCLPEGASWVCSQGQLLCWGLGYNSELKEQVPDLMELTV